MKCPYCEHTESKVIDSRPTEEFSCIRRRRECLRCERRFTTYEKVETYPLMVVKRDGSRQMFDRQKILNGILRACNKRDIPMDTIDQVVEDIETAIFNLPEREISSEEIGVIVMEKLKNLDQVAYIRFVSVYRDFKDINSFLEELKSLKKE